MTTDRAIGFAIIGCGRAGHFHMDAIASMSKASLHWLVDTDAAHAASCAKRLGCKDSAVAADCFSDPAVDAVIIASVTNSHYSYIKAALLAGKAVYTEKPISHDPAELLEIVELAESTRLPFMVGYQRRIDKNFLELQAQCAGGAVGQLRVIKCCSRDNPLPPLEYLRVSGGIFCDMLCHDIDMIHFLSNQVPLEMYAIGHCYNADIAAMNDIDTVVVSMKFASGLMATVDVSRTASYGYDQRVEVFGELGMVSAHNVQENTVVVATERGYVAPRAQWSFPQRYQAAYPSNVSQFADLVRDKAVEEPAILRRHIDLERCTAAAELSWLLRTPVKLDSVDGLRHHLSHHLSTPLATPPPTVDTAA